MTVDIKTLQARLSTFVSWIAPDSAREDEIRTRADNVRTAIKDHARADNLTVQSTPSSGSFATRTGLRRHMRGLSEVEGLDIDVPFVVSPLTKDDEKLTSLLPRFAGYAEKAYPKTKREQTKSSVRLEFDDKISFDLVPLLATTDPERQILIRANGERRETSIQKHVDFVRTRTKKSNDTPGVVKFNEVVRLLKWFRYFRQAEAGALKDMPSFVVILLAAHAFDTLGVQPTYAQTFADWCGHLARVVKQRTRIAFATYLSIPKLSAGSTWQVLDPLNQDNSVVSSWSNLQIDELAEWFEEARDSMYEAMAAFQSGRESDGMAALAKVFGTPIQHHSEPAR